MEEANISKESIETQGDNVKKPGHDARQDYARTLMELLRSAATFYSRQEYELQVAALRNYYSLAYAWIKPEYRAILDNLFAKFETAGIISKPVGLISNGVTDRDIELRDIRLQKASMAIQFPLIQYTTHLLTPVQESDEDNNFDPSEVLGRGGK